MGNSGEQVFRDRSVGSSYRIRGFAVLLMEKGEKHCHPEQAERRQRYFGLDKPQYARYATWVWNLMHRDLGLSLTRFTGYEVQYPAKKVLGDRIWVTVPLTGFTVIVTSTLAVPVGIYSGVRPHSVRDYALTFLGFSDLLPHSGPGAWWMSFLRLPAGPSLDNS